MAGLLGDLNAAAGAEPEGETAEAAEPESKVQWSEVGDGKWKAEHNGYTFLIEKEGWGGKGFTMTYTTPTGAPYLLKPRGKKPTTLDRAKSIVKAKIASGDLPA